MQNRLSAALVALAVVVASGTAPTLAQPSAAGSPGLADVVWDVQPATTDDLHTQRLLAEATEQHDLRAEEARAEETRAQEAQAAETAQAESARAAEVARVADEARVAEEVRQAEAAQAAATTSQVQQALLAAGYVGAGTVDGIAGTRTTAAVRAFQADAGYPVDGEASASTLTQLAEKAETGWRKPAPVRAAVVPKPAAPAPVSPVPAPAGHPPAAAQAPAAPAWTTYVANSGGQSTVDLCAGGLTAYSAADGGAFYSVPYLAIHNNCGGAPILRLSTGDAIVITGGGTAGTYEVVDSRDVTQGATTDAVAGMAGDILLQTCYFNSTTMRVVGAVKVS